MEFLTEATEEEKNLRTTLSKVPESHADLIKGYKYKWQAGNTLKGDDGHIGIINPNTMTITIAAPWNYGREYTLLHELAHKVWETFVPPKLKRLWKKVVNSTKHKMQQNAEELFCMAYANHFAKNKILIHTHKEWEAFIEKVVEISANAARSNSSEAPESASGSQPSPGPSASRTRSRPGRKPGSDDRSGYA